LRQTIFLFFCFFCFFCGVFLRRIFAAYRLQRGFPM